MTGKKRKTYGGVQLMELFKKFSESTLSQCKILSISIAECVKCTISNISFCQYSTVNGHCRCIMQRRMIIEYVINNHMTNAKSIVCQILVLIKLLLQELDSVTELY